MTHKSIVYTYFLTHIHLLTTQSGVPTSRLLLIVGALAFLEGVALLFALHFGWATFNVGTTYKIYSGKFCIRIYTRNMTNVGHLSPNQQAI